MSSLGSNGRFANQLFQYLFIILYGFRSGCKALLPRFPASGYLDSSLGEHEEIDLLKLPWLESLEASFLEASAPARNVDIWGYFQGIPAAYRLHKPFIRKISSQTLTWRRRRTIGFARYVLPTKEYLASTFAAVTTLNLRARMLPILPCSNRDVSQLAQQPTKGGRWRLHIHRRSNRTRQIRRVSSAKRFTS